MAYNPQNPNGSATSADSAPVVIASDQSTVPVSVSGVSTSSNQTNGSQKSQIVDGSNNVINSTSNALNVAVTNNALVTSPFVGQAVIASTGTAVRLNSGTSQALTNGIIITAPATNVAPISVGGSGVNNTISGSGNGYLLSPGASISFAVGNTNDIYINGTSADYVSWAGS